MKVQTIHKATLGAILMVMAFTVAPPNPARALTPQAFLVFFDWNSAEPSGRAKQLIAEAANFALRNHSKRVEVDAFTDTSMSSERSADLSDRMAKAVAGELVNRGVPASAIFYKGFGKTNLWVPTDDGVQEAQNRRVQIIVH